MDIHNALWSSENNLTNVSISTIRNQIKQYCKQINAPKRLMTVISTPSGFGDPHIEIDKKCYHYVIWERGSERERRTTENLDELMFWIMKDITFNMASDYELKNRIPKQDSRRLLFQTQLKLLKKINNEFYNRLEKEINNILINHPYNDSE